METAGWIATRSFTSKDKLHLSEDSSWVCNGQQGLCLCWVFLWIPLWFIDKLQLLPTIMAFLIVMFPTGSLQVLSGTSGLSPFFYYFQLLESGWINKNYHFPFLVLARIFWWRIQVQSTNIMFRIFDIFLLINPVNQW